MNTHSRIIFLILLLLHVKGLQATNMQIEPLTALNLKRSHVLEIFEIFLFDQDSITLIHENEPFVNEVLRQSYSFKPNYVFSYVTQSLVDKISGMGRNEMVQPRTTKSYLRFSNDKSNLLSNLKYFSKISTNGKWIFYLRDFNSLDDAKDTLIKAWKDYNMSNVILFYDHKNFNYTVTFYNPFDRSLNATGKFWDFEVKPDNKLEILKRLHKTFHRRYGKKLRNFQLVKATLMHEHGYEKYFLDSQMSAVFEFVMKQKMDEIQVEGVGRQLANGSFNHDLKLIEEDKVDIVMTDRIMVEFGLTKSTFLNPVGLTYLNFIVQKRPREVPRIFYNVTGPFDWKFKILYILMILMMVAIIKAQNPRFGVTSIVLQMIGVLSAVGVPMTKHIKVHQRITFCCLLIFSLIVCGSFQGCIVKKLNFDEKIKDINSLKELTDSTYNLTTMSSVSRPFKPVNGQYVNEVYRQLDKRSHHEIPQSEGDRMIRVLDRKNQATLLRDVIISAVLNSYFNGTSGEEIYHVIPEVALTFHTAYLVPKTSPFIPIFNAANIDAQEFGFKLKSKRDYHISIYVEKIRRLKNSQKIGNIRQNVVITMRHLKHVFIFFAICLIICSGVFIAEVLMFKKK